MSVRAHSAAAGPKRCAKCVGTAAPRPSVAQPSHVSTVAISRCNAGPLALRSVATITEKLFLKSGSDMMSDMAFQG